MIMRSTVAAILRGVTLLAGIAATTSGAIAAAAIAGPPRASGGPLQVSSSILVESRSAAADGTTRVTLVKPVKVTPGDKVIFVLAYRNTGAQPLANVVLDNPLPSAIAYRSVNPGSPAPEVSIDGKTYGPLAGMKIRNRDGTIGAAGPDDVVSVRWHLATPLTAGGQGQFAFQAVLR